MRLIVTGGGTGGHVFPALEVALGGKSAGWDVRYFGSLRGQERAACGGSGMDFEGFPSEPLYKLASLQGIVSLIRLTQATGMARRRLEQVRPEILFSTGGYSSAPVVQAARKLKLPYVIHEQNSAPGRTNLIMAKQAKRVCSVFHHTAKFFPADKIVRTGMPIRAALREGAQGRLPLEPSFLGPTGSLILVVGGSQGSAALNDVSLATAARMVKSDAKFLHSTGVKHFAAAMETREKLAVSGDYDIRSFLDADSMARALFECRMAVCRSGAGTLSELAAFRKPSVLVPYPHAHGQHQLRNAEEFAEMGAAEILNQSDLDPSALEGRILSWILDEDRVQHAQRALAEWDIVDSVPRILKILQEEAVRP